MTQNLIKKAAGNEMAWSIIKSDVKGFTSLTEKLTKLGDEGVDQLADKISDVYSCLMFPFASICFLLLLEREAHTSFCHWGIPFSLPLQSSLNPSIIKITQI